MGEPHFVGLPEAEFAREAVRIVEAARERGAELRVLGALAIYLHSSEELREKMRSLGRLGEGAATFTDLDLAGYRKHSKEVKRLFERELGFKPDFYVNRLFGSKRLIYYHPQGLYHVDVFFDKLEFSHDVEFGKAPGKGRLELDYPTISITDLVLEKLQIHEINRKDIVDLIAIFLAHPVSDDSGKENIDGGYIARLLANDWGFWYDATSNLRKVLSFAERFGEEGALAPEQVSLVKERVEGLERMIEEAPKSKAWIKRSKKGTSKPWYREVGEL